MCEMYVSVERCWEDDGERYVKSYASDMYINKICIFIITVGLFFGNSPHSRRNILGFYLF